MINDSFTPDEECYFCKKIKPIAGYENEKPACLTCLRNIENARITLK